MQASAQQGGFMKKHNMFPLLAALIVLLAAGSAFAQADRMVVKVPFDFVIGNKTLPAGQYDVHPTGSLGTLTILGEGEHKMFAISYRVESTQPSQTSKLIFNRYGNRYFLSQVWIQGNESGRQLPKTGMEKELAKLASNGTPETVVVAALK
jgi:hypothetical protein